MCSQQVSVADLSTRARIREAAVLCFARHGFTTPLRLIAAHAEVSAALVIHHFGSEQALREACDERVLERIRESKHQSIRDLSAGKGILHRLSENDEHAPLLGYLLQLLHDGGPVAASFIEHLIEDAIAYSSDGVSAGLLHPSRDERARARYLTLSAVGALLLELQLRPPADGSDLSGLVRDFLSTSYPPMLELYTQGLFTTRRLLDDYLLTVPDPRRHRPTTLPPGPATAVHGADRLTVGVSGSLVDVPVVDPSLLEPACPYPIVPAQNRRAYSRLEAVTPKRCASWRSCDERRSGVRFCWSWQSPP